MISVGPAERRAPYADGLVIGRFRSVRAARSAVVSTFPAALPVHGAVAVAERRRAAWWKSDGVEPLSSEHRRLAAAARRVLEASDITNVGSR